MGSTLTLRETWESVFRPRDRRPTYEWAAEEIELFSPLTITGKFNPDISRHYLKPLELLDSEYVRALNIKAPARGGKTLIAELRLYSTFRRNAMPTLWVFQEDKAAKDESELRIWPHILGNPCLRRLLPPDRHKARGQQIIFPHMPFHIVGPADSNLQSRGWQQVILDEVWLYKQGKLDEAKGRLGDYEKMGTDKLICLSQAGDDKSDWAVQYNSGVINEWYVECQSCGHYMVPKMKAHRPDGSRWGIMWDQHKDERGLYIPSKVIPTVRFECEKCAHPHIWSNRLKGDWNRTGKYIAEHTDKNPKVQSVHWYPTIDFPWDQLVEKYLSALNEWRMGNPLKLIKFLQKNLAEDASERSIYEGGDSTKREVYEIKSGDDEMLKCIGADVQSDRIYWQARATNTRTKKSYRMAFGHVYSCADLEAKREELGVNPKCLYIDTGYKPRGENGVYAAIIRYGWVGTKGVGTVEGERKTTFTHTTSDGFKVQRSYSEPSYQDPEIGSANQDQAYAVVVRFSSDVIADRLDGLIESGLWVEPVVDSNDPEELAYQRQLKAEFKKIHTEKFSGRVTEKRVCPSGNNHQYDCAKHITLCMIVNDVLPDPMADEPSKSAA